jgi:curved DNA-binding protein CbpA
LLLRRKFFRVTQADYFAVLGQPRQLALDREELKRRFHELAAVQHPDAVGNSTSDFALLNAAYHALDDPRLRLEHFLKLNEQLPGDASNDVPADLADLFFSAAAVQKNLRTTQEPAADASAIARAVWQRERGKIERELEGIATELDRRYTVAVRGMETAGDAEEIDFARLRQILQTLTYLDRWRAKVREDLLRLRGVSV